MQVLKAYFEEHLWKVVSVGAHFAPVAQSLICDKFWSLDMKIVKFKTRWRKWGYKFRKHALSDSNSFCSRSSHRRCSMKRGVLKNFAKLTGKHLMPGTILKKRHRCFLSVLQNVYENLYKTTPTTASAAVSIPSLFGMFMYKECTSIKTNILFLVRHFQCS